MRKHHNDIQVVCWKCLHVFWTVASHKAATVKGFCSSARMCLQGGEVEDRNPEWISQLEAGFLEMPCLPPVSSTTSWSDDASSQSLLSSHVIYKKSSLQFVAGQRAWQWGCKALDSAVVVFSFPFIASCVWAVLFLLSEDCRVEKSVFGLFGTWADHSDPKFLSCMHDRCLSQVGVLGLAVASRDLSMRQHCHHIGEYFDSRVPLFDMCFA